MKGGIDTLEWLANMFFEVWLWVTVALLAILSFFGKRLVGRWDKVMDSHMPDHEIEGKLTTIRDDMEECQSKLAKNQHDNYEKLSATVGEVHTRLDNLYELLLKRRENPRD